jgi:hypothetical protein
MKKVKRMSHPLDSLAKRQSAYACDVLHQFNNLPGTYAGPLQNEYPSADGAIPRVDSAYCVTLGDEKYVLNWEDESTSVDIETLKKIDRYRKNLEYGKAPVISVITTDVPLDKCLREIEVTPTLILRPLIISYLEFEGSKRLSIIESKIRHKKLLNNVEAMNLIMIPRMLGEVPHEILERICYLLKWAELMDEPFKLELIFEMRCIIHKYAETEYDIYNLEGVIGLQEAITAMEHQNNLLIKQGIDQGIEQGIEQGNFQMALKVKKEFGIDKAVEMSGFSKEELENEKLNNR